MSVVIWVEGGGDAGSTKAACREAFRTFFERLPIPRGSVSVKASGGRFKAYKNFCDALRSNRGEVILLLVDSERPVKARAKVWDHLKAEPDKWKKPASSTDEQAHLMVQAMEAWFFADTEALATYYDQGFLVKSLPRPNNIEEMRKDDLVPALEHASRNTTKEKYHKTQHGFSILKLIDPTKVRQRSIHAHRLFEKLERETRT